MSQAQVRQPNPKTLTLVLTGLILAFQTCFNLESTYAGKLDLDLGFFNIQSQSQWISNFGYYSLTYRHALYFGLEAGVGYTMIMTNIVGGDSASGFDVYLNWFPLSETEKKVWSEEN